mgnify:CR=1 FL=1
MRTRRVLALLVAVLAFAPACRRQQEPPAPLAGPPAPIARKAPVTDVYHGVAITGGVLLLAVEDKPGVPLLDAEELVDTAVYLVADFFPGLEAHHH